MSFSELQESHQPTVFRKIIPHCVRLPIKAIWNGIELWNLSDAIPWDYATWMRFIAFRNFYSSSSAARFFGGFESHSRRKAWKWRLLFIAGYENEWKPIGSAVENLKWIRYWWSFKGNKDGWTRQVLTDHHLPPQFVQWHSKVHLVWKEKNIFLGTITYLI